MWCTNILDTIEKNNPNSEEKCCEEMLKYWCNSCNNTCTWSKLIEVLKKIHQYAVIEMIKKDNSIKGQYIKHNILYIYMHILYDYYIIHLCAASALCLPDCYVSIHFHVRVYLVSCTY